MGKLGVIGTGNMGKALLGGFVNGGVIKPEEAWCFDVYTEACTKCAARCICQDQYHQASCHQVGKTPRCCIKILKVGSLQI